MTNGQGTLHKGIIRVLGKMVNGSGKTARMGRDFHHAAQNSAEFKTKILFISQIFHLIFSHYSSQQVTKTM